jgi:hypothetical protein
MKKYIVTNCPAYNPKGGYYDCWANQQTWCQNVDDCLIKRIINDVETVYRTPEYFEELEKTGDKEECLIEYAWHNVAHMVLSKVNIKDIEE